MEIQEQPWLEDDTVSACAASGVNVATGASTMRDFHDKSLASGRFLLDLLAAVEPRCVDRQVAPPI